MSELSASPGIIRRLDHVAVAVGDTEVALQYFRDRLRLPVVHQETLDQPHVKLTYLDAGNALIQLIEPLDAASEVARSISENGEGIHHICFGVDNAVQGATELSGDGSRVTPGRGRGRISAFVPGEPMHGVRIECTELQPRSGAGS